MGFETEKIEEVRFKADIVELVQGYVKLKKKGANFIGLCPFHNEHSPSFTVNKQKSIYKCFGCGESGGVIDFVMKHDKKSFPEAVKMLAEKYNIELPESGQKKEYVLPVSELKILGQKFIDGLKSKRGISNRTINHARLTEDFVWMPKAEKQVPVICFNYFFGGELVNIKYRAADKDMRLYKDAKLIFYNMPALEGQNEIIITEGEIDCLSFIEAQIYNCVSVPNGAAKGVQKLEYVDNCYEAFMGLEKIILCVDNDATGRVLQEELARRFGKSRCLIAQYPEDKIILDPKNDQMRACKDANEVLLYFGVEGVKKMYQNAKEYPLVGEATMDEMELQLDDWYNNGYPPGLEAGIVGLDEKLRFAEGRLTVVTGIPGHGKDEFVNYVCTNLAKRHEWVTGVFGFEEEPEQTVTKIAEKFTGKAYDRRKDLNHRMNWDEWQAGKKFAKQYFKFIRTDDIEVTVEKVIEKSIELVHKHGINALILSPWASLEHALSKGESETMYISRCLARIVSFAKKYRVHVFLMAHPYKVPEERDRPGVFKVPNLYMISGSANFYNKTHNGITVYRNFKKNQTDVHILKVKFYWEGETGVCSFHYNTLTRQYEPMFFNASGEAVYSNIPAPEKKPAQLEFKGLEQNDFSDGFDEKDLI